MIDVCCIHSMETCASLKNHTALCLLMLKDIYNIVSCVKKKQVIRPYKLTVSKFVLRKDNGGQPWWRHGLAPPAA